MNRLALASVTAAASLPTQRTVEGTVATLDAIGRDLTGPLVVTVGAGVSQRESLSWWESRALYGWRVLVPQTRDRDDDMLSRLAAHGAVPETVRTIAVEPPRSPAQMERAVGIGQRTGDELFRRHMRRNRAKNGLSHGKKKGPQWGPFPIPVCTVDQWCLTQVAVRQKIALQPVTASFLPPSVTLMDFARKLSPEEGLKPLPSP